VARLLPSPGALLLGWIAGGLLSFAGALVFAELGASIPNAGGQYLFPREAYGDLVGFLYGWSLFTVIHTGSLAALAVGYAEYFGSFVPALGTDRILVVLPLPFVTQGLPIAAGQLNAVFVIAVLSVINYFGVKEGSVFQGIVTVMKIGSFAGFILLGVLVCRGSLSRFTMEASRSRPAAAGAAGGFYVWRRSCWR
jgi:APA family basic amino acid/polyamine antiporter